MAAICEFSRSVSRGASARVTSARHPIERIIIDDESVPALILETVSGSCLA